MSGASAGWYPSPDDPALQRYWDGAQWTDHVARATTAPVPLSSPTPPAGWHLDPDDAGHQRYWDGQAWTDQVRAVPLFDGMVPLPDVLRKKQRHLLVTTEEVVWNDEVIRWDEVTWLEQLITLRGGITTFEIWLVRGDRETRIMFGAGSFVAKTARAAYDTIIVQLRRTIGQRIINGLLEMVADGEPVRTAGLVFAPEGFGEEGKGALVPWTEFAGLEIGGYEAIFAELFRQQGSKRKRVARVKVDILRSWAIPPVVELHSRRYGALAGSP